MFARSAACYKYRQETVSQGTEKEEMPGIHARNSAYASTSWLLLIVYLAANKPQFVDGETSAATPTSTLSDILESLVILIDPWAVNHTCASTTIVQIAKILFLPAFPSLAAKCVSIDSVHSFLQSG